ncbi:MAG: glycoside hydrolase family 3 C-terminal domain-containing protein [Ruminococcus sp.]|nr:glycoside hydrolase family 3 C-terminal domain-containing protein [Ruminococcus sp.]
MDKFRKQAKELVKKLTLDEKIRLIPTHQLPVESVGLKEFNLGTEAARGFVGRKDDEFSTVFPQPVGLAGTFDTELMQKLGEIAGRECRAYYNENPEISPCFWGPTVDMERDPRWGRTEEAYGEDVCLAGEMTKAYTKGMAGYDENYFLTIPTLKHFCANNNEENRIDCNAYLPLRLKYEYYYAAFMNAIKYGGARSVMTAYNEINGLPAMLNPELNTILKDKWGLWYTVTDGGDFSQTVTSHEYYDSHSETLAEALKCGCDIMTDDDVLVRNSALKAVEKGLISEEELDKNIENIIYARLKLGQLADDCPYNNIRKDIIDNDEAKAINLRAAEEQIVMLKNNGILPIKKIKGKIGVVGALADENLCDWYTGKSRESVSVYEGIKRQFPDNRVIHDSLWDIVCIKAPNQKYLSVHEDGSVCADKNIPDESCKFEFQSWGGGSINLFSVKYKKYLRFEDNTLKLHNRNVYDWFTFETFNISLFEHDTIFESYLHHQRMKADENGNISFEKRTAVKEENKFFVEVKNSAYDRAETIAKECEYVFFCTGNHPMQTARECYDRKTLRMNVRAGLIQEISNINRNTVMILVSSYPYAINTENRLTPAILYTTHAGPHLGTVVANTIVGENNPAGRLALTWYMSEHDLPEITDYDIETNQTTYMYFRGTPLYPFGYGLSYSDFEYGNFTAEQSENGIDCKISVKNISNTDGDEVVQIYYSVPESKVSRPIKKLCAFARVNLKAGEEKILTLRIPEHILQIYDTHSGKMLTENGKYKLFAGSSSADIRLETEIKIKGENIPVREDFFEAQYFDRAEGIKIFYLKNLKKYCIRVCEWFGIAEYNDVNFKGKKTVTVKASSFARENILYIKLFGKELQLNLKASDGYDDFSEYSAQLPENLPDSGKLALFIHADTEILDIKLS